MRKERDQIDIPTFSPVVHCELKISRYQSHPHGCRDSPYFSFVGCLPRDGADLFIPPFIKVRGSQEAQASARLGLFWCSFCERLANLEVVSQCTSFQLHFLQALQFEKAEHFEL
jgi:hypothetical protein